MVAREVIDLTEDDGGSVAVEIASTRDDDTMAEGEIDLTGDDERDIDLPEADVSMASALNMAFDFSDDDNFMVEPISP